MSVKSFVNKLFVGDNTENRLRAELTKTKRKLVDMMASENPNEEEISRLENRFSELRKQLDDYLEKKKAKTENAVRERAKKSLANFGM